MIALVLECHHTLWTIIGRAIRVILLNPWNSCLTISTELGHSASHAKEKYRKIEKSSNTKKDNRKLTVVEECLTLKSA